MKLSKIVACALAASLVTAVLVGCAAQEGSSASSQGGVRAPTQNVPMAKVSSGDLAAWMESGDCVVLDVRKSADYAAGHVPGAVSADMDPVRSGRDYAAGVSAMRAALSQATGAEDGGGKRLVLVCYSGNNYAQAGTNVLSTLGADMANVFTLEGGVGAWRGPLEK